MTKVIEWAIEYAKRGFPVFPVNTDKTPCVPWKEQSSTNPEQIKNWHELIFPDCNFGCDLGKANLFVVDVDSGLKKNGGTAEGFKTLAERFPQTHRSPFEVSTPSGGRHIYFRAVGLKGKNNFLGDKATRSDIDIKSVGGYVVIAGSIDPRGEYKVLNADPLDEYSILGDIPGIPNELEAFYRDKRGGEVEREDGNDRAALMCNTQVTPDTDEKVEHAVAIIQGWEPAPEGVRNESLYQLAREIMKAGLTREKAEEVILENAIPDIIDYDPVEDEREVRKTIASAYRDTTEMGSESMEVKWQVAERLFGQDDLDNLKEDEFKFTDEGPLDCDDESRRKVPNWKWFIKDWLVNEPGIVGSFGGTGGNGKSLVALHLLTSLATGDDFFGLPIETRCKGMYVGCEESRDDLCRRIQWKVLNGRNIPRGMVALWSRQGQTNPLCSYNSKGLVTLEPFFKELYIRAKHHFQNSGGVLILDTLSDFFIANENDRGQSSQFVKYVLVKLAKKLGVTLMILSHPPKGNSNSPASSYSGSTAWDGSVRFRWFMYGEAVRKEKGGKDPEESPRDKILMLAKSNASMAGKKVYIRNDNGVLTVREAVKFDEGEDFDSAAKEPKTKARKMPPRGVAEGNEKIVLEAIEDAKRSGTPYTTGPRSRNRIEEKLVGFKSSEGTPFTEFSIKAVLNRLLERGVVENVKEEKGMSLVCKSANLQINADKCR